MKTKVPIRSNAALAPRTLAAMTRELGEGPGGGLGA